MFYICSMNTHSKLREIGFTRTAFHKPNEFLDGSHNNMVLDNVILIMSTNQITVLHCEITLIII